MKMNNENIAGIIGILICTVAIGIASYGIYSSDVECPTGQTPVTYDGDNPESSHYLCVNLDKVESQTEQVLDRDETINLRRLAGRTDFTDREIKYSSEHLNSLNCWKISGSLTESYRYKCELTGR